jgi:Tol biopolymer transport system component
MDWSQDGRFLLYRAQNVGVRHQLWALSLTSSPTPFSVTPPNDAADARTGQFSPDGKWVAYESNASGRYEIYVQSFPKAGVKAMVSTTGGLQPRWNPDGKELFYVSPDARLTSVSLRFGEDARSIEPASPVSLFPTRINGFPSGGSVVEYDVSGDGRRFLMNTLVEQTASPITLILNRSR